MNSIFTKKTKTEENTIDNMASLSHTKWNCKYHIVFTPKKISIKVHSLLDVMSKIPPAKPSNVY